MPRFNTATISRTVPTAVNRAGGLAYDESAKLRLVSHALTSFVNDQYYRSAGDGIAEMRGLLDVVDPMFAAKAAIVARTQFGMRSISHVIAGELAGRVKGQSWMKHFFRRVALRPDDMLEIRAYYNQYVATGKGTRKDGLPMVPNQMKDGFALRLRELDGYRLAKYRGDGRTVNMFDVVNATHPGKTEPIDALMKGTLGSADTWEVALSAAGQAEGEDVDTKDLKADAWKRLLEERKLGYFALLRNLRNIMKQAPEVVTLACEQLMDEDAIRKSLVLPFRFTTAYDTLQKEAGASQVLHAVSRAMDISVGNVAMPEGTTLVALDVSGSMGGRPIEIGSLFAAAFASRGADLMLFTGDAKYLSVPLGASASAIVSDIKRMMTPRGTNFHSIFETAKVAYDNIVIISDMQGWMASERQALGGAPRKAYAEYRKRTGATPKIFSFDIAGYGTLQFPEDDVYALAGFSDKTLDIVCALSIGGKDALVRTVEETTFD